ncbi:Dienelactone hydrolase [Filimonas lacunae]|uniref:Dienelactone hydrolase n=1 Tax=Filimonas lacunae TaxID=477680 RepID=A0A173MR83_9BACT|nr:dienelactone hydrolase family protein [Filimonas lacunae]BAV09949.1 dienelactone hydrolase family protein [Filimonas lacunae]SIS81538.1 Dienelactone hydrolase [Filimonas lacunae]
MKKIISILAVAIGLLRMQNVTAQGYDFSYQDNNTTLKGYYCKPKAKGVSKIPGVIILHAWTGITDHEKNTASILAQYGYHALAADIYGSKDQPANTKEAGAVSARYKKDYVTYQSRIRAAINALIKQGADADNIVIIGYCFGGTGALEAARGGLPVKGVVCVHGGLGKDSSRNNIPIKPAVLVLHGADDPHVSEKEIKSFQQEMRSSKADWQMIYFANAVHAFTDPAAGNDNSKGAAYNKQADERSWQYLLQFLKEVFQ